MKLVIYLFKKIIPLFVGATLFFALILNLVDLFMHIATYLQNNSAAKEIIQVMLFYFPKTVWYAVPVATLFSTSYVLSDMYANNESIALFASGVSLFKFTMPLMIAGFIMSFCLFGFENYYVVDSYEKKISLQNQLLNITQDSNNSDVIVISDNGKIIYKARRYTEANKRLNRCYFLFRDDDKQLKALIYTEVASWNQDTLKWDLQKPIQYTVTNEGIKKGNATEEFTSLLTESYEIFRKTNVDIQAVSAKDAKVYIKHLKKAGLPYNKELSEYYKKFAFPFIILIVILLSIGLTGRTRKNVLLISLASCISSSVLYYVTMMVTMVLARHGYINAFMGAWSPVIFFTIISVILFRYSRT